MLPQARSAAGRVAILAIAAGLAACSSSSSAPTGSASATPCAAGSYCVNLHVSGALEGELATAQPPAGFLVLCKRITSPRKAWVAHVYGSLNGALWHLVVETNDYSGPGHYSAVMTLTAAGAASPAPADTYVGQGTATVGGGGASASVSGTVRTSANARVTLSGTLSCTAEST